MLPATVIGADLLPAVTQLVAIKVLRSERVQPKDFQTYIKEVQLIQSFNHPHVLSFVGVCCEPPHVCIGAGAVARARARGAPLTRHVRYAQ